MRCLPSLALSALCCLLLWAPTRASAEDGCVNVVEVTQDESTVPTNRFTVPVNKTLLTITPNAIPPTRTVLSLDHQSGVHIDVEWDPFVPGPLVRQVLLPSSDDSWQVTVWSEPSLRLSTGPYRTQQNNFAWRFDPTSDWSADERGCKAVTVSTDGPGGPTRHISLFAQESRMAPFTPDVVTLEDTRGGIVGGERLFGALGGQGGAELLQILGEVVVDRASGRINYAITKRFQETVCEDLDKLLPKTCQAIKTLRFDQLATSGRALVEALLLDLVDQAVESAWEQFAPAPGQRHAQLKALFKDLIHDAIQGKALSLHDVQALALGVMREWPGEQSPALQFVVQVGAYCHNLGGCDVATVDRILRRPEQYIGSELTLHAPQEAVRLVMLLQQILSPPPDVAPRELLLMTFQFMAGAWELEPCLGTAATNCSVLGSAGELLEAVLQGKMQEALILAGKLKVFRDAEKAPAFKRVALVGGALAGFVLQLDELRGMEPAQAEARRAAIKDSIEAMVDAYTDRSLRNDEWIVSISGALRLQTTYQLGGESVAGPLSLPLGVGLDYLGEEGSGLHLQFNFFDLGRYARVESSLEEDKEEGSSSDGFQEFRAQDALALSLDVAYLYGRDLPLIAGLSLGLAPAPQGAQESTHVFFGFFVGVDVPLWDFN